MNKPVIVTRLLNAPVDKVWNAITDKHEMHKWYFQVDDFKPEVGFRFQFFGGKDGDNFKHLCEVTEVIPGRKLTHSWRYEGYPGNSFVTWELVAQGEHKTMLTLTHTGLETLAAGSPDFAVANFVEGWNHIVNTGLPGFVEDAH